MNRYREFQKESGEIASWPTSEEDDTKFLTWLGRQRTLSGNSVEVYFSAFKNHQELLGFDLNYTKSRIKRTQLLLQGIKNTKPTPAPGRTGVDLGVLNQIREAVLDSDWEPGLKMAFWAGCLTAFFGSFRLSEILPVQSRSFDSSSELAWPEVDFEADGSVRILIKRPKTKRGTEVVYLFRFEKKNFCPVRALQKLKCWQETKGGGMAAAAVFAFRENRYLSRSMFCALLARITKMRNLGKISGNSFRAGIPTIFENAPELATDRHVKSWGRWRSKAYQHYMRADKAQKKWLFDRIQNRILNGTSV